MSIFKESYLSAIHNLTEYKSNTLSSNDIDDIIEKIKEYDFLIVSTDLNLTKQINKLKEEICSILFKKNEDIGTYFCSAKYCIVNNKLVPFNKKKCKKHEYILFCDDCVVKYIEKIEDFRQDIYLERDVINTLADKYDFVKKQAVVDFVDGEYFVNLVRKNIKGESCKDRFEALIGEEACYNSIRQTFQQLHILEKEGFIYTDLKLDNILYDFSDNTYNLIDLGSVEKIKEGDAVNMNEMTYHRNHFLDLTTRAICSVYNVISHNDYINVTKAKGRERKDVVDVLRGDEFTKKFVERFVESGKCGGYGEFLEFFEEVVSGERNIGNNGGDMSYTEEDTIFVQIGCYRDPELQWTLKDLFEKAKRPENIFVGIFLQYDKQDEEDNDLFQIEFPRKNQLRIEEIDYRDSVSICYSKNKTAKLYKNEKYVLQTDSHMRFRENWDEILVNDFKSIEHKNPVLCSIMPGYSLEPIQTDFNSSSTRMGIFETHNTFRNYLSNIQLKNKFEHSSAFFGPFLFFKGELLQYIKCNEQYGSNDEFPTCVKIFTNGANMFFYKTTVVNHLYGNNITNKMKKARIGYFDSLDSNEIFRHQFNIKKTNNKEILDNINKYPLGTKRTLRDYERFTGVDFRKLIVKYHGYIGVFEEWQEVGKIKDIKNIFSNNYKVSYEGN